MTDVLSGSVAERTQRMLDLLTPTERKPAQRLLANYPVAGLETVARFAADAGVSGPSVLRFVSKLGYGSYSEFQQSLRKEFQAQFESPLTKRRNTPPRQTKTRDRLDHFSASIHSNIEETFAALSRRDFEAVVRLLGDHARPVHLLGGRFTDPLAAYLYQHLRALRPRVYRIEGQPIAWAEYLLDIDQRDVVLIFDVRRYQADLETFAERAAERGARIVLFTDQWLSPIARLASHVFAVRIDVQSSWDSAAATLALTEAIITELSETHWQRIQKRIEALEDLQDR